MDSIKFEVLPYYLPDLGLKELREEYKATISALKKCDDAGERSWLSYVRDLLKQEIKNKGAVSKIKQKHLKRRKLK